MDLVHVGPHHEYYNGLSTEYLQYHHLMLGFDVERNLTAFIAATLNPVQTSEERGHVAQLNAEHQEIARKRDAIENILHERNALVPRFPGQIQSRGHGG